MNQDQIEAITTITALVSRHIDAPAHVIGRNVLKLAKLVSSLHKRYEAACNYEWASTEKYEKQTERLERKTVELGVEMEIKVEHQRDPRGWPLILTIGERQERLG